MKWIISDCNIPKFLKALKAMTKIGPDVHFQTSDRTELKMQAVNNAHSVHFSLTFKETFFLDVEETLIQDSRLVCLLIARWKNSMPSHTTFFFQLQALSLSLVQM